MVLVERALNTGVDFRIRSNRRAGTTPCGSGHFMDAGGDVWPTESSPQQVVTPTSETAQL